MLQFPNFDPVALRLGPLAVRWYGLMYLIGFGIAYVVVRWRLKRTSPLYGAEQVQGLMFWALSGLFVGARLGEILFYHWTEWDYFLKNPLEIIAVWHGGMSFHGGFLGALGGVVIYLRRQRLPFWLAADTVCLAAPLALMLGRLGNFINGELYGRVSNLPWAMVFPHGGPLPRHPSQLYELLGEGPLLFVFLWVFKDRLPIGGMVVAFVLGYSLIRFLVEFVREPDSWLGVLALGLTMGQWLSLIMALAGGAVVLYLGQRGTWTSSATQAAPPNKQPLATRQGKGKAGKQRSTR
ncbi:Phosphatidylglycerol--prolipoprotein diacylglyceryl transferase [Desulfarculales bacterium]